MKIQALLHTLVTVPWKLFLSVGQNTVMRLPNRLLGSVSRRGTLALRTMGTDLQSPAAASSLGLALKLPSAFTIGARAGSALCTNIRRMSTSLYSAINST